MLNRQYNCGHRSTDTGYSELCQESGGMAEECTGWSTWWYYQN